MNNAKSPFIFGIDYELEHGFFIEHPLNERNIKWRISSVTNCNSTCESRRNFNAHPISLEQYRQKFDSVQHELRHGNSFLANLTIKTPLETDYSMDEIFALSNSRYALMVPGEFVCFSPETFVTISQGVIRSNPMKGTISASIPDAEQVILNDMKERAEHNTIVDFIRSDLSRVATDVNVERFRYFDRLHTTNGDILQVSSQISGRLTSHTLGDTIWALLPAGSISGAPKIATVKLLKKAESEPRGFYSGVFGYFDGEKLDSAVMIRYIENIDGKLYFRSGGGITINSNCRAEYEEALKKIYLSHR